MIFSVKPPQSFQKFLFVIAASCCFAFTFITIASFTSTAAQAQTLIDITSVNGKSAFVDNATTPTIYGGVTGAEADCAAGYNTTTECNNCTVADQACNRVRIHAALILTINFKVVGELESTPTVYFGDASNQPIPTAVVSAGPFTKGSNGYVQVEWSSLCDLAFGETDCEDVSAAGVNAVINVKISFDSGFESSKTQTVQIKVLDPEASSLGTKSLSACAASGETALAATDSGVCNFTAHPGDQKVYLDHQTDLVCDAGDFKSVRFYYSNVSQGGSFAAATYNSNDFIDLPLNSSCTNDGDWILKDLNNGDLYAFRASFVDQAGNNVFLNDHNVDVVESILAAQPDCALADQFNDDTTCTFAATPGEVVGLLPEDFNCFIATAAYGTGFAQNIFTLRKFRNQILLKNSWGKKFVHAYYKLGPSAAKFISDKPILRAIARGVIYPFWVFAWLSLYYGMSGALIIFVLAASILYFSLRKQKLNELMKLAF